MLVYVYAADIYCDDCGRDICARLDSEGAEDDGDSDSYPQRHDDGGGESDTPRHCGSGPECINAEPCGCGEPDHKVGAFLENPLTDDGRTYVRESLGGREACATALARMWAEHYGIKDGADECVICYGRFDATPRDKHPICPSCK